VITIPLGLRKKYSLKIGSSVALIEDEGKLTLIPLKDIEALRKKFLSKKEMAEIIDQTDQEEMELE
jgi:bifunctional DNA-binding transcriptional regulator/antitoxin component of YhaV-PrlF toxin-antitoxin module